MITKELNNVLHYINIEIYGCEFDIRINDFSVEREFAGLKRLSSALLNPYLKNDINIITISLKGVDGANFIEKARCKCELIVCDPDDILQKNKSVLHTFEDESFNTAGSSSYLFTHSFTPDANFPNSVLEDGEVIEPSVENFKKLFSHYIRIHKLFETKNYPELVKLFALKNKELSYHFKQTVEEREKKLMLHLETVKDDKLDTLEAKYLKLKLYSYGKIAALLYFQDYEAIFYENEDKTVYTQFPLFFFFDKQQNDFRLIR